MCAAMYVRTKRKITLQKMEEDGLFNFCFRVTLNVLRSYNSYVYVYIVYCIQYAHTYTTYTRARARVMRVHGVPV